ncbi:hypothetical protein EG68_10453 [Paragonimus skrjabini miyazakii]|uniref:Uncharacterized protein n=1 Tax=Paragonimus skrjabini miyazakii TaxID=59628 RepID=A0A8S9YVJ8_9TREM|nr:hypothetical protein EG68_10453 [Paragonimus skrjabini miyazakii]
MSNLGGPMAGSAVDHADDLGDDLHANIVYSDAKRHFRTPIASSVYQPSCLSAPPDCDRPFILVPSYPVVLTTTRPVVASQQSESHTPSSNTCSTSPHESLVLASPVPSCNTLALFTESRIEIIGRPKST